MSETDRLAMLESSIRGINAWNSGMSWIESREDQIYFHSDGSERSSLYSNEIQNIIRFSDTLNGCHRSVLAHIRDMNPLKRNDYESDMAISIMRHIPTDVLMSTRDSSRSFRYRIYEESCGSDEYDELIDSETRDLFSGLYDAISAIYLRFTLSASELISEWSDGIFELRLSHGMNPTIDIISHDWIDARGRCHYGIHGLQNRMNETRISLHQNLMISDGYDAIYATIDHDLPFRPNDGHQWDEPRHIKTPRQLAGRLWRMIRSYYGGAL